MEVDFAVALVDAVDREVLATVAAGMAVAEEASMVRVEATVGAVKVVVAAAAVKGEEEVHNTPSILRS
eukprot:4504571-Prymnesium_polylepis.1